MKNPNKKIEQWISESCDKMFTTYYDCMYDVPNTDPILGPEYGMKLLNTFACTALLMIFISERDKKNRDIFEEKAIDVKRIFVDNLSMLVNQYFNRDDSIISTKTGNA